MTQLGEHMLCMLEVSGSVPGISSPTDQVAGNVKELCLKPWRAAVTQSRQDRSRFDYVSCLTMYKAVSRAHVSSSPVLEHAVLVPVLPN